MLAPAVRKRLRHGVAIPAHPLALTAKRRLDEQRQRALTRYYLAAGAGGLAVGVHSTQFEIRIPTVGLYQPVLELAAETVASLNQSGNPIVMIAGVMGRTRQALSEAAMARDLGYHIALVGLAGWEGSTVGQMVSHLARIAEVLPVMGFYLQPAVGGRILPYDFWRRAVEIPGLVAIKIAPFDRYQTAEVVRAVSDAGRDGDIALYTGNDDHIIQDLLTGFCWSQRSKRLTRIVGGLLGQWAVWTKTAVEILETCREVVAQPSRQIPGELLTRAAQLTDANGAVFDAANGFAGAIPGIHEVLRAQGLLAGRWCLDRELRLSPGQLQEIDRVRGAYPHLTDDEFVRCHLDEWMR